MYHFLETKQKTADCLSATMSPVSSLWLLCIAITSAINDPYTSRYFIGNFTINPGTGQSIIQPYALNICVQEGLLIGNYVFYECSADNQTLTKRTYSTSDSDCLVPSLFIYLS